MIETDTSSFKSEKIIDMKTASEKIDELKNNNKTVGLCHGGFDILHPGHIKHFESASKLCDCLVVSVTSDRFVASRKGDIRPIFSEILRAYAVASIAYVNYVIISDYENATDVIGQLKPSYYIKGPDFVSKDTPGITAEREEIKQVGGEMIHTQDPKLSTSDIIRYIKNNSNQKKILLGIDRDGTLIEDVPYLGREEHWKTQIKLKNSVIDLLTYIQTKYDTIKIVISNQQGVARGYFDEKVIESINSHINSILENKGIKIDRWTYSPDVDVTYTSSMKSIKFLKKFIKQKTQRKPSPDMLLTILTDLNMNLDTFDKRIIIGNSKDDAKLAEKCNSVYIDVTNKNYDDLKKEFDMI